MRQGILFIISSPSGGGKGTLIRRLLQNVPDIGYSVSFTTREMRDGEQDGKDYSFVTPPEFENLIAEGEFLEYAEVHGHLYGTSRSRVREELAAGHDIVLEIDVQGAEQVKEKAPDAVGIFILPPSFEVLRERLVNRHTEGERELALRLKNSRAEVAKFTEFDYVIINDELERALCDLEAVIRAERIRKDRQIGYIEDILETFDS